MPAPNWIGREPVVNHHRVIHGEGCRLGAARLKRENITFKQVPYQIELT